MRKKLTAALVGCAAQSWWFGGSPHLRLCETGRPYSSRTWGGKSFPPEILIYDVSFEKASSGPLGCLLFSFKSQSWTTLWTKWGLLCSTKFPGWSWRCPALAADSNVSSPVRALVLVLFSLCVLCLALWSLALCTQSLYISWKLTETFIQVLGTISLQSFLFLIILFHKYQLPLLSLSFISVFWPQQNQAEAVETLWGLSHLCGHLPRGKGHDPRVYLAWIHSLGD